MALKCPHCEKTIEMGKDAGTSDSGLAMIECTECGKKFEVNEKTLVIDKSKEPKIKCPNCKKEFVDGIDSMLDSEGFHTSCPHCKKRIDFDKI